MMLRRTHINEQERGLFFTTLAFLKGRLEERGTIDWALKLNPNDFIKRQALLDLINDPEGRKISDPWKSAWWLIEEFWNNPPVNEQSLIDEYVIKSRIDSGDRSGSLIFAIVDLVAPRLKVEKFSDIHIRYHPPARRPKKVEDLFSLSLTSGKIIKPHQLGIERLSDKSFLLSLAQALDAAVTNGLDIARRMGWDSKYLWQLGQLHRVYFVPDNESTNGEDEPDEFNDGIAPSTKLLQNVVSRLVEIDICSAIFYIQRWKSSDSAVHLRLWASMSRDMKLTSSNEVSSFLLSLDDVCFWDKNNYPEISELRAKRFNSFSVNDQEAILKKLKKGPPRNFWSTKANLEQIKQYRLYSIVSEFRRIEIAGAQLNAKDKSWLAENIKAFPELANMNSVDGDFHKTPKAEWVSPNPDNQFDLFSGVERLNALEAALSSARRNWEDRFADRAADWIREKNNYLLVLSDFETTADSGSNYINVWERFAWTHSPDHFNKEHSISRELTSEGSRVITLLVKLPIETIRKAIEGISQWINVWAKHIKDEPRINLLWERIWPIAVDATNAVQSQEEEPDLNIVAKSNNSEPRDLDTLNTPAGKLVWLFLSKCPEIQKDTNQFGAGTNLRQMADQIVTASGRSGLIAKHRMIASLAYFLNLDEDWAKKNLIAPLLVDDSGSLALWRSIARQTLFLNVLKSIGDEVLKRINDERLGRATRQSLLFSLVLECLNSRYEKRDSAVDYSGIQQAIRGLDDEIRAHGAQTLQRFVVQPITKKSDSPEKRFRLAVIPFLKEIWPQERSLNTPGISRALADLPAASEDAFAEAVDVIERFLVPFPCWSMNDYGLYGSINGQSKLSIIDTHTKASALLTLLNLTIGTSEVSVIPHDLSTVLNHIREISPKLADDHIFRRLSTSARRG